jgi:hypothetical protein
MKQRSPLVRLQPLCTRSIAAFAALFTILTFLPESSRAALAPGDIVFIGMNTEITDEFTILTTKHIPGNEVVYFTDAGWDSNQNAFRNGESHHSYTFPFQGVPAGTVLRLTYPGSLSSSGDQLLAYQGNQGNPQFIAAINNSGFSGNWQSTATSFASSALPPGLVNGFTAIAVPQARSIKYNCIRTEGLAADLLADIGNRDNWLRHSQMNFELADCGYSVTSPGQVSLALRAVPRVNESGNGIEVNVYSTRTGNYSASVAQASGTATDGSDIIFPAPLPVSFANSQKQTVNIPLLDDNQCEGFEDISFFLMNVTGANAASLPATTLIADDEDQDFEYSQGFESTPADNWPYTVSPSRYNYETQGTGDILYSNTAVWEEIRDFNTNFNAVQGQFFYGMSYLNTGNYHYIDFAPVNVTGIDAGELRFRYITVNLGSLDEIQYAVAFDNGSQWGNYQSLAQNNQEWTEVKLPIPPAVDHVRIRFRTREVNGIVCAGVDDVGIIGADCATPVSLTTGTIASLPCITGATPVAVPFTSTGAFAPGNVFTAQLSDANGDFSNAINIGTLPMSGISPSGTINATIPATVPAGSGYRIRVIASNPATTGTDNGVDLTIRFLDISLNSPTFNGGYHISCPGANDGSIDLTVNQGSGGYTYSWTGPNGFTASSEDLSNLEPGTYAVSVSDAGGCVASETITLTEPTLSITLTSQDISCFGAGDGTATVVVNGSNPSFLITWTGPNGPIPGGGNTLSNLSAGTYSVVVTDQNGCTATGSATISQPFPLTSSFNSPLQGCGTNISCAGGQDGSIDLAVNGGTTPYTYSWTGPGGFTASSQDLSNLGAGSYSVTVTDQNGCTTSRTITLTQPDPITGQLSLLTYNCGFNLSCAGATDGEATLSGVGGGCPPYSYAWSNGSTSATTAANLGVGSVSVTITDASGCSLVLDDSLLGPDPIQISANITPATCISANNGAIDITVNGGCPPYTYNWTGIGFSGSSEDISGLFPGVYSLSLTDANGCTATFSDSVTIFNDLSASIGCCQDTSICEGDSVQIRMDFTGQGPWLIVWTDGTQTYQDYATFSPYYVTVSPQQTTTYSLVSLAQDLTDCSGPVCGSATVAVNDCENENCDDLCVNTGVLSQFDNGGCRTVTLELACDTLCNSKTPIKSGGACTGTQTFNFNTDPNRDPIPAGTIAGNQWASMGITVSVINNNPNHPQAGVIFDSGNITGGDDDLGTPNQAFGGPGIGPGGGQGMPGQNDTFLGNLLVIAENGIDQNNDGLIDDPDDEAAGGEMRISFAGPYFLESVTMVDLDNGNGIIRVHQFNGDSTDFNIPGLGDNAVTDVGIFLDSVQSFRVILPGSGGIAALAYCPVDSQPEYVDISIPCGNISSFSNSLGLPMQLVVSDPVTGVTGLRIMGLPGLCQDSTGTPPFTVTYEVCNLSCDSTFCPPLMAYVRNGCVQYENAVMGSVMPPPSQTNNRIVMDEDGMVEIYPNPVAQRANIRLTCVHDSEVVLEMFDMTGTRRLQIWEGPLKGEVQRTIQFQTGDLPAGVYFLRMTTDQGTSYVRKFVVLD